MDNVPSVRPTKFVKGRSGNPNGRPKGSKNRVTLMKLALELDLRTRLNRDAQDILAKAVEMAKAGDTAMIKLLVDKMLPTSRSMDEEPAKEKVQIFIDRLPDRELKVEGRTITDGEYNEK
jgi:Family of unknown function (DUF5681)